MNYHIVHIENEGNSHVTKPNNASINPKNDKNEFSGNEITKSDYFFPF